MDPTACLKRFIEAIENGDDEEIKASAADLVGWMNKGGFMPKITFADLEFLIQTIADKAVKS